MPHEVGWWQSLSLKQKLSSANYTKNLKQNIRVLYLPKLKEFEKKEKERYPHSIIGLRSQI